MMFQSDSALLFNIPGGAPCESRAAGRCRSSGSAAALVIHQQNMVQKLMLVGEFCLLPLITINYPLEGFIYQS